eukprot:s4956_g1.t1
MTVPTVAVAQRLQRGCSSHGSSPCSKRRDNPRPDLADSPERNGQSLPWTIRSIEKKEQRRAVICPFREADTEHFLPFKAAASGICSDCLFSFFNAAGFVWRPRTRQTLADCRGKV